MGDFECPVCFEEFVPPIYQCYNGHLLCKVCIEDVPTCPICREEMPLRKIRNLEIEKITSSKKPVCKYSSKGCQDKTKHEPLDCLFAVDNFCRYLGLQDCGEVVGKHEFVFHLMEKHGISGEFAEIGEPIDVQQTGGCLEDIDNASLVWGPSFIVHGENILFFMTHVRPKNVSWAVYILGSETLASQFTSEITISQGRDVQGEFLKWSGPVHSLAADGKDDNRLFNLYSQQLNPFCGTIGDSFGWNMRVAVSKSRNRPSSSKAAGNYQINSPATASPHVPSEPRTPEMGHPGDTMFSMFAGLTHETFVSPPGPEGVSGISHDSRCSSSGSSPKTSKLIFKCLECENFNSCFCTIEKSHVHHVLLISDVQYRTEFSRIVQCLRREGLEGRVTQDFSGVHRRIQCNGCKMSPVLGLRYKCIICADYDSCRNCFKKGTHEHPSFLVVASPNTAERLKSAFLKIQMLKDVQP